MSIRLMTVRGEYAKAGFSRLSTLQAVFGIFFPKTSYDVGYTLAFS